MKHIFVNLKRFDIPPEMGGVNNLSTIKNWAAMIIEGIDTHLDKYHDHEVDFTFFFPEAHLLEAVHRRSTNSLIKIGSQSVYREDTTVGGNFGSFTTNLTANAARSIGCSATIIGHCEERKAYAQVIAQTGVSNTTAINGLLNKSVKCAESAGLKILYCVGEKATEQDRWQEVLKEQLEIGLEGLEMKDITIAYEPVWAIGPGKTPPNREYIMKVAKFLKDISGGAPIVYGGGLKDDNAQMLASIDDIDGGLIALTQFTGKIGFYPEGFLKIVETYLNK